MGHCISVTCHWDILNFSAVTLEWQRWPACRDCLSTTVTLGTMLSGLLNRGGLLIEVLVKWSLSIKQGDRADAAEWLLNRGVLLM